MELRFSVEVQTNIRSASVPESGPAVVSVLKLELMYTSRNRIRGTISTPSTLSRRTTSRAILQIYSCLFTKLVATYTHSRLTALCPGLPGWAGTRKVEPICISLKQETVSGSGISWSICKSAPRSRQITTPASHHSVFHRPDALPAAQPTASKHWRHNW